MSPPSPNSQPTGSLTTPLSWIRGSSARLSGLKMLDRRISFIIAAKCSLKDLQVGVRQMPEKEPTRQPLAGEDASIPVSMMTPSAVSSPIATSISSTMTTTGPLIGWAGDHLHPLLHPDPKAVQFVLRGANIPDYAGFAIFQFRQSLHGTPPSVPESSVLFPGQERASRRRA